VADPRVSEKTENRKGRLFVESAMILRELVEEADFLFRWQAERITGRM